MPNKSESNGVSYAADLPLSWTPLGRVSRAQDEQWQYAGVTLLRALAVLEAPIPEVERDVASAAGKAMERMEAKLDLALSMMTQVARQQAELPPLQHVVLRAHSLEWSGERAGENAPAMQQRVLLSLHLSPKLPLALTLPATVSSVEVQDNDRSRMKAEFVDLSGELEEWLERTLFRFHRRSIQQSHSRQP